LLNIVFRRIAFSLFFFSVQKKKTFSTIFTLTKHRYCPWIRSSTLVYKMDVIDRYFLVLLKGRKRQF